ncbi:hypothetical protein L7F22_009782 [Adiantum nelumboides]|nr:hypothetical protein [Adiantum nelumboides]
MLTAKGLLSARPRQGTIVQPSESWNLFDGDVLRWLLERPFAPDLLIHFSQLRLAIEPEAAALAAVNDDPQAGIAIRAGLDRMKAAAKGEDEAFDADMAFHSAIMIAASNPFFLQLQAFVSTALKSSIRLTNKVKGELASIRDHEKVAWAIDCGDADGARQAMRMLVQEVIDVLRSLQSDNGGLSRDDANARIT